MKNNEMKIHKEGARATLIVEDTDVIVCGAGPAGIAAAIAAARTGARTTLLEVHGCLGGVWTAGALACVLGVSETGIMAELIENLDARRARAKSAKSNYVYDVEAMKLILDEMVLGAGIRVQLHTRVVAAVRDAANHLTMVVTESKSGRQAWTAKAIIDTTGDGDVAALAGCRFDYGHPETGQAQPMTLMAVLAGIHVDDVDRFVAGGLTPAGRSTDVNRPERYKTGKDNLLAELRRAGIEPSYRAPSLWCIHDDVFALMANHEYGVSPFDAEAITNATINARREVHRLVDGLRSLGGAWNGLRLVGTGAQIGVREGRRIHGRYRITVDDLLQGTRHEDGVCHVTSGADVHSLSASEGGYLSRTTDVLQNHEVATEQVAPVQPYDVPLRALIARDVDGLLIAGRCISGDFLAHASYRLTGYAVPMGQAAGVAAGLAATSNRLPHELPWDEVQAAITAIDKVPEGAHR